MSIQEKIFSKKLTPPDALQTARSEIVRLENQLGDIVSTVSNLEAETEAYDWLLSEGDTKAMSAAQKIGANITAHRLRERAVERQLALIEQSLPQLEQTAEEYLEAQKCVRRVRELKSKVKIAPKAVAAVEEAKNEHVLRLRELNEISPDAARTAKRSFEESVAGSGFTAKPFNPADEYSSAISAHNARTAMGEEAWESKEGPAPVDAAAIAAAAQVELSADIARLGG